MTTTPPKQAETATENESAQDTDRDISFKWLIVLLGIIAACLNGLYFMNFNNGWGNQADFGAFGDFLGGVLNPVLGFATVGLLIWSLRMQMNELALSREQLTLTRQELKETKEETALSRRAMEEHVLHLQQESSFNELLRLMSDIRSQFQNQIATPLLMSNDLYRLFLKIGGPGERTREVIRLVNVKNVLYEYSTWNVQRSEDIKIYLKNDYKAAALNRQENQWLDLEQLLLHFSKLVLSYHYLSKKTELTNIYLDEARKMLQPFQDVFWTDGIAVQLSVINGILHETKQSESVE